MQSNRCNLRDLPPAGLVAKHEEAEEWGGYFVINGNERLIRFLIVPRRNHVTAIVRPSFSNRGATYTKFGVSIRCVRPDQTSQTNTLHFLDSGSIIMRFTWRKNEYLVPVLMILKGLVNASDKEIFKGIILNDFENTFITDRVELLLRDFKHYSLFTGEQCLQFLGDRFRVVLGCPEDWSNEQIGNYFIKKVILVHLANRRDKFRLIL